MLRLKTRPTRIEETAIRKGVTMVPQWEMPKETKKRKPKKKTKRKKERIEDDAYEETEDDRLKNRGDCK